MQLARATIAELFLDGCARIKCPPELIPAPGQYVQVGEVDSDSPLPVSVFSSDSAPNGFRAAPVLPSAWNAGTQLMLRGPLGRGFNLPRGTRKIALIAFDDSGERLRGLLAQSLSMSAEVVLLTDMHASDLPVAAEVQPLAALAEVAAWADFIAADVARENLLELGKRLLGRNPAAASREAQILIRTAMPCGALADCGACAIQIPRNWKMICSDGPVFQASEIF